MSGSSNAGLEPMSTPKVSCVLPTLNARRYVEDLTAALDRQSTPVHELIVIDSASEDGTAAAFDQAGARVVEIRREDFGHGTVRNLGAREASGNVLVFMTQDAVPADDAWLAQLVRPLASGEAAASFARQLARPDASPLERYARGTNYPDEGRIVSQDDVPKLGVRAAFFSNSCSAVRADVFADLDGFPTELIMNEDMLFAVHLLREGHRIAYAADARVWHSHAYGLRQTFARYFDIGVVFDQAHEALAEFPATGSGLRYVSGLLRALARERRYAWLPVAVAESASKALGFWLGRRHAALPRRVVRRLSLHEGFWARV